MSLAERLARLGEVLVALSSSPVPTHLFQTLGDHASGIVPSDYLAVCLLDPEQGGYFVHSLSGSGNGAVAARVFGTHEGLPGRAIRTGQPCVTADLAAFDGGVPDLDGALAGAGLSAALAVPVRRGLDVLGALLFAGLPPVAYAADDVQIASLLAAGLSGALETSRAYQALADERSTLAAVLGSSADAVVMVNQDGLVLLANPAVRPMLGLAPEPMIGRPLTEVVDHAAFIDLFEHGRPGATELTLPDGRTAQASLITVTTQYGEPVGWAAILRDITLLKNLEAMKNDFVNTVSHDLKNPISVIVGTAELLLMGGPRDTPLRQRYQRIRDTAIYMSELVTDLLDLGKIEAGLDAPGERIDAVPLIEEVVTALAPQAEAKQLKIGVALPAQIRITATPRRLKQALLNLVGNAIKYTPALGHVGVSAVVSDELAGHRTVSIRVTDTGIGIPERDLPHVFDKFYRVRSPATAGISGTGLGLAITRSIVDAHGGRIRVESAEGVGSCFVVDLPLSAAPRRG